MRNNKTIKWGVIGTGDVCEVKSVPAMIKMDKSIVKSVMSRNLPKAKSFAKRHAIEFAFDDADKLIQDPEIDIVYVATPPSSHAEYAIKIAQSGKAAYVEKPMATTYAECLRMNKAFKKANQSLFVAYYRRTLPNFLKIKELIESGYIGKIRMINILMIKSHSIDRISGSDSNWRVKPEIAGGGYFYDLASHQLDFLDFLFGRVTKVWGGSANQARLYKAEDIVTAGFAFQNGVIGSGNWCFTANKVSEVDRTIIIGEKGQIEFASFGDPRVIVKTEKRGREEFTFKLPEHIQANLVRAVCDELRGQPGVPSTGESAARTNRVMEKIVTNKILSDLPF